MTNENRLVGYYDGNTHACSLALGSRSFPFNDLAITLQENKNINEVDFSFVSLCNSRLDNLINSLKGSTTVTNLGFARALPENGSGVKKLLNILRDNKTLTTLDLRYNCIEFDGTEQLVNVLLGNNTLTKLYLGNNDIGEVEADLLARFLRGNCKLSTLQLKCNEIGDIGAASIASSLKVNKTLSMLEIADNEIGDMGAAAIANALQVNTTLTYLDLGYNDISATGGEQLLNVLSLNENINNLLIKGKLTGDNNIRSKIKRHLRQNETLTTLVMKGNPLGKDIRNKIKRRTKGNLNFLRSMNFQQTFSFNDVVLLCNGDPLQVPFKKEVIEKLNNSAKLKALSIVIDKLVPHSIKLDGDIQQRISKYLFLSDFFEYFKVAGSVFDKITIVKPSDKK